MDTGDDPNAGKPRGGIEGAHAAPPPARPPWTTVPIPTPVANSRVGGMLRDEELSRPSDYARGWELVRRRLLQSATPSSAAPPSDHPGAERTGSGTRVRQSVLYSDRPRWSRLRRPTEHVEHPSEVSSSELEVTNLPAFEALSVRDSPTAFPSETEERPGEVKSSELGSAVTDLPTLEALSLMNELPLFISDEIFISDETSGDSNDDDADEEHHSEARSTLGDLSSIETMSASDTQAPLEEHDYGYDELSRVGAGQPFLFFSQPKGISRSMVLAADPFLITVSDDEEQPKPDSDVDSDESESESESDMEESERPCATFREFFDRIYAIEQATLTARAAECGTELPSAVIAQAAAEAQRQQETRSLQAPQQDSTAATQRHEASTEDIVRKGKKWMCEEVMLCFKKYIERRPDLVGLEYKLDDLCHQCFNVGSYNKVFHHYNFRVMMKMPSSVNWTVELYFAEVKQIFGRNYYFCCPLEQDEDGDCYACKNQGMEELKHPATGGFDIGSPDAQSSFW